MTKEQYLQYRQSPTTAKVEGSYQITPEYKALCEFEGSLREQALQRGLTAHMWMDGHGVGRTSHVRFEGEPVVVERDGLKFLASPGEEIIGLALLEQ